MDKNVSIRISVLRYLMIAGIVILHVPPYVPLNETGAGLFPFIKAFFSHGVFRSTVPVLACISGFLLFSSSLDRDTPKLLAKKIRGLALPMFIWNFPLALLIYAIQAQGLFDISFSETLHPFNLENWMNAVFGVFSEPVNYPLNFLRDLFVIALLAPVFGIFLRKIPWVGLAIVSVFFWYNLDGELVLRNTMPINFYIGGMAAILAWDLKKLDHLWVWLLLILICSCFMIVYYEIGDRRWFKIVSPFLIWPLSACALNVPAGKTLARMSKFSFFIFLSHGPLLLIVWQLYSRIPGDSFYPVFWFVAPIIVIFTAQALYLFFRTTMPGLLQFLLGGR